MLLSVFLHYRSLGYQSTEAYDHSKLNILTSDSHGDNMVKLGKRDGSDCSHTAISIQIYNTLLQLKKPLSTIIVRSLMQQIYAKKIMFHHHDTAIVLTRGT